MIRIIHRCLTESKLTEREWDGHFAFYHNNEFKSAKKVFLNGKPLNWYDRFKNGDVIEIIDTPHIFSSIGSAILIAVGATTAATSTAIATTVGVVAYLGIMAAVSFGVSAISGALMGRGNGSATTQSKEYSSTTQPELRGASNDISNDIIPVVFGRTQQTPSYAQLPYRLVNDGTGENKYRQFFIPNYNNVVYSDYKLGETPITNYLPEYYSINTASASSSFIGFDNCKAVNVEEEMSYDKAGSLTQSYQYDYNNSVTASTVTIAVQIRFSNLPSQPSYFSPKSFNIELIGLNDEENIDISNNITIKYTNLVSSGSDKIFSGSITISQPLTYLSSISVTPSAPTRNNKQEETSQLNVSLDSVTVTAGSYTDTQTPNAPINNYNGVPSEVIQTSPANTNEIDIIFSFGQGLYTVKSNGNRKARTQTVEIQYKLNDSNTWTDIGSATTLYVRDIDGNKQPLSSSNTTVSGANVTMHSPDDLNVADQLFFRTIGFEVPEGVYNVRVRSAEFNDKTNYDVGYPTCSEIQFRTTGDIVNPLILPQVNQLAFEVKAYKGLSGTLKKFNYIAEAEIPIWNGSDWNTTAKTSNPAAIIRFLLTNESVNPRAEKLSHIDNDSLVEYYEWCEESGYKADGVIAEACKIGEVINSILQNSQAAMIPLYNGKHTFAIDKGNKIPVGLFNMHNSWDFKWMPTVGRQIEAIRASFVENDDWTEDELTLYWYNGQVNDTPEAGKSDADYEMIKKEYKYVCDRASVRQIVAYELETIQTKRNQFEFTVNLEALNMMLLDRIYVSNTTNMRNESTGLIKSVITNGSNMTGFELYAPVDIPENAKITIRSLDYDNQKSVINIFDVINSGESDTVQISPITYDGVVKGAGEITGIQDTWHYDGDLFSIGQETIYDCTITDIKYNDDGTATITARDYGFNDD